MVLDGLSTTPARIPGILSRKPTTVFDVAVELSFRFASGLSSPDRPLQCVVEKVCSEFI